MPRSEPEDAEQATDRNEPHSVISQDALDSLSIRDDSCKPGLQSPSPLLAQGP